MEIIGVFVLIELFGIIVFLNAIYGELQTANREPRKAVIATMRAPEPEAQTGEPQYRRFSKQEAAKIYEETLLDPTKEEVNA